MMLYTHHAPHASLVWLGARYSIGTSQAAPRPGAAGAPGADRARGAETLAGPAARPLFGAPSCGAGPGRGRLPDPVPVPSVPPAGRPSRPNGAGGTATRACAPARASAAL